MPEVSPDRVAVLFVNEDVAASSPASIAGSGFLNNNMPAGPPDLSAYNVWHADVTGVDLNGNENFGVVIVVSRDPAVSLTGSLQTICSQDPTQVTCYRKPYSSTGGLSFIHSYSDAGSGTRANPFVRQVELLGGCGTDLSAPYFNVDGGCPMAIQAKIDFGVAGGDPTVFPTCAVVTTNFGAMTWAAGGLGGPHGTWTGSLTPGAASGRNVIDIDWETDVGGANCGGADNSGTFPALPHRTSRTPTPDRCSISPSPTTIRRSASPTRSTAPRRRTSTSPSGCCPS